MSKFFGVSVAKNRMDNKSHYNQSDQAKSPEKENIKQSENELLRAEAPRASSLVSSDRQKKNIQPGQKNFLIAVLSVLVIILSAIIILSELNICQSIIAKLTNTIQTLQKTMLLLPDKEPEERQEEKFPAPEEQDQETLVPNKESPAPEKETIYFGAIWKDDYSFINISSEEIKEVIPPGYKIVDEYRQEAFPDFFRMFINVCVLTIIHLGLSNVTHLLFRCK